MKSYVNAECLVLENVFPALSGLGLYADFFFFFFPDLPFSVLIMSCLVQVVYTFNKKTIFGLVAVTVWLASQ